MGQRRIILGITALLAAIALMVSGCGGSQPESEYTGTDTDEMAPAEAQEVIRTGLETMFTWFPARDTSTADAYQRALPYLGPELQAGKGNRLERGNSVWWQEWKDQQAEVTAVALLVAGEHPEDKPDTVQRAVLLTQTVKAPDGKELDSTTMRIERVVAKKRPEGWRVEEINFFPVNEFRTQICPPGQSHQPPPDGPCAPNPPPQQKQCPDGTTVAPDQVCPSARTGPQTKQCPDGTTVPADATCPSPKPTSPPTKQCPDGTTVPANQDCPAPRTTPCPDGTTVPAGQDCPTPKTTPCPDGTTVPAGQDCPIRIPCPDGSSVTPGQTCPPVKCPDGSTVVPPMACPVPIPCPDGSSVYLPQTCPPVIVDCPEGMVPTAVGCVPAPPVGGGTIYSCCDSPSPWLPGPTNRPMSATPADQTGGPGTVNPRSPDLSVG